VYSSAEYGFLHDLETISAKLYELQPQAIAEADENSEVVEDEELLRELREENEADQSSTRGTTRTRQPRRPSMYGYDASTNAEVSPTARAQVKQDHDEDDDAMDSEEEEHHTEAEILQKFRVQSIEERKELREKAIEVSLSLLAPSRTP
jgi:hypothetical protein